MSEEAVGVMAQKILLFPFFLLALTIFCAVMLLAMPFFIVRGAIEAVNDYLD